MIDFPCRCGHKFSVPQDMAGGMIQCPRCHRLADVPTLSDLAQIEPDGTIRIEPLPPPVDHTVELRRAFARGRIDEDGQEYDLRPTLEDVMAAGGDEVPLELKDEVRPGAPKYDPETGELVSPMVVRGDEAQAVLPLPAGPPTLSYAEGEPPSPFWRVPFLSFKPGSAAVIGAMLFCHLFALAVWVPMAAGLFFAGFIVILIYGMIVAHYAIIVEDIGPFERDELPTPLRGMSWSEDVWYPLGHMVGSLILCYLPAVVLLDHRLMPFSLTLAAVGTFFFPAVLLTFCTSGDMVNLRPDRLVGLIGVCGMRYVFAVMLFVVTSAVYLAGFVETIHYVIWLVSPFGWLPKPWPLAISAPLLVVGIYLMHLFCWYLGLLYRRHHEKFPWVLQRHVWTNKMERRIPRRRPSYTAKPKPGQDPAAARAGEALRNSVPQKAEPLAVEPLDVQPLRREPRAVEPLDVQPIRVEPLEDRRAI